MQFHEWALVPSGCRDHRVAVSAENVKIQRRAMPPVVVHRRLGSVHEGCRRRGASADRGGGRAGARGGRERRRRVRRRRVRRLGHREPADRARRGRLHARPPRRRAARRGSPTSSSPTPGLGLPRAGGSRDAGDRRRLRRRQRDDPGLPDRARRRAPCPAPPPASRPPTARTAGCRGASCSQPAIELARDGVELTRAQAHMHAILDLILRSRDEGRRVYSRRTDRGCVAGDAPPPARPRRHARRDRPPTARRRSTAATGRARSSRPSAAAAAS